MVNYLDPDLFYEHESAHIIIVNADADVEPVSQDEPNISNADFIITEHDIEVERLNLDESICSNDDLTFGLCESARLRFTIYQDTNIPNLKETVIAYYIYFNGDSSTLFHVGNYIVETDKLSAYRTTRDVDAYDILYYLRDYDITEWYRFFFSDGQTHSIGSARNSLFEWFSTEVEEFDVEQETRTLVNDNYPLEKSIESDTINFGFFMQGILEVNGVFGHINRNGKFDYITLPLYSSLPSAELTDDVLFLPIQYEDFNTWGIGYVSVYDRNNNNLKILGDSEYRHPSIYCVVDSFVFTNNSKRATFDSELTTAVQNMRDAITGHRYRSCELNTIGNLCYEVGDLISVRIANYDDDGTISSYTTIKTYILERKFTGLQSFKDVYIAKGHKKQPPYQITNDNWHVGDSEINSLDGMTDLVQTNSSCMKQEVVLPYTNWDSTTKTQTITVAGILSDETLQFIQIAPFGNQMDAFITAQILVVAQGSNSLTFKCTNIPVTDLHLYVVMFATIEDAEIHSF